MWVTSISLPISNEQTVDADGFVTDSKEYMTGIPANRLDTTRDDEMLANQCGYTADVIMEIDRAAYSGQSEFIDEADGTVYAVKRSFEKNRGNLMQLTGERRKCGKVL